MNCEEYVVSKLKETELENEVLKVNVEALVKENEKLCKRLDEIKAIVTADTRFETDFASFYIWGENNIKRFKELLGIPEEEQEEEENGAEE